MHTRQTAIDNLRGFLVLLVILGHTALGLVGMYHDNSSSFLFVNYLYKIIYSFHMSCFIAISGYLFQGLPQKTLSCYGRQIQHKAIALLIPYTLCSIIYWCIKYAISRIVALLSYGHFAYEGFNYIAGYMMYFYLGCLIRRYHDTICKRSVCLCLLLIRLFSEILYLNCILGFLGSVIVCYLLYEKFFKHIKYIDFLFYPSKYIRKTLL